MDVVKINAQKQLDELLCTFDWENGFLREAYVLSPGYIERNGGGVVAPDAKANVWMLFTFEEGQHAGLELILEGVDTIYFPFRVTVKPVGVWHSVNSTVELKFDESGPSMRVESMKFAILDRSCWGNRIRYGNEDLEVDLYLRT